MSTIAGDDVRGPDSRRGLTAGASAIVPLSSVLSLQLGAGYSAKGAAIADLGLDVSFDLELGYLEAPLLVRVEPPVDGTISPHFMIGPVFALRSGCHVTVVAEGVTLSADCQNEIQDMKETDFGAMAGAGLDIATSGSLSVTLDVLYNLGLTSIAKSIGGIKNRSFSVVAGIAFPVG